ncbi:lipase/acyltransferase domain-containing protein [Streptomyces venezuelae]|nr:hypothetical protein [Streptomyces venezuelae]
MEDLVVVVPGIMGSRLADAEGRPVWDLSGGALTRAVRTLGGSLKDLRLPAGTGDDHPGDGVRPIGLMPDLHVVPGLWQPVDGYTGLMSWLSATFGLTPGEGLLDFPYDWRLSCRYNARLLRRRVEEALERRSAARPGQAADARVVFICHSMGGLVARHYVECLGGHAVTRRVITLGTPHRGSLDALGHLVNGLRKGWGPLGVDLTAFARSLPSLHQLAPDYACVAGPDGSLEYARDLPGLPGIDPELLADAARFHAALRTAADRADPTELHAVVGVHQPTATTARYTEDRLVPLGTIGGADEGGDGTVPRLAARPANAAGTGHPVAESHTACEQHGSLQNNPGVRDTLIRLLGQEPPFHRGRDGAGPPLGVHAPGLLEPGDPYQVTVTVPVTADRHDELALTAELHPAAGGRPVLRSLRNLGGGRYTATYPAPDPGGYRLVVRPDRTDEGAVTALTLVGGAGE